ncbi:hypothetical protein E05_24970 [Plautia stali symbiont]|nr:hypothetical protein E05_24970 [Plautia stali symbiont]
MRYERTHHQLAANPAERAVVITLLLSIAAIAGSTLLGLLAAVLRTSRLPIAREIAVLYT